jgi:uncharacterized protein (TIGR02284 family)
MSTDEQISKDLIQTCKDGREGFAKAAGTLAGNGRNELAERFREFSTQRDKFATELEWLAGSCSDDADTSGSVGALHRGWMTLKDAMSLKDALSGSDPEAVLEVAEQGENHATSEYAKALDTDISAALRTVVARQFATVQQTQNIVRDLRDGYAAV